MRETLLLTHPPPPPPPPSQVLFPGASWMPQIFGIFFSFVIGNVTSSMHFVMLKYGDLTKINK